MVNNKKPRKGAKNKVSKATKNYVKKTLDKVIEDKVCYITQLLPVPVSNVTTYHPLNVMPSGAGGLTQRIGNRIRMKSMWIQVTAVFTPAAVAANTTTLLFRIIVLYDRQPNTGLPSNVMLLESTAAGETVDSPFNIDGFKRYKIISDVLKICSADLVTPAVTHVNEVVYRKKIKLHNLVTVYNTNNAGTIADINSGSLILCLIGETADIQYTFKSQLIFEDA